MRELFKRFWADEEGQDLVEYVLLMALIALATAAIFPDLSGAITGVITDAIDAVDGAGAAG